MDQQLIEKVMKQVSDELGIKQKECRVEVTKGECCGSNIRLTKFVGTAIGDTIGLVVVSVSPLLVDVMKLSKYRSIGIVSGRVGTDPQVQAVDETVKTTNTKIISMEPPGNAKDGVGHDSLICTGADDVSDARRTVEIVLQVFPKYFGDVYGNNAGHPEFQYTARTNYYLGKALGTPVGRAFGMTYAGPAAIGIVLADIAVKAVNVKVVGYCSPSSSTSYSNKIILTSTDDSETVYQAVEASIEAGKKMLRVLGDEPKSTTTPYIQ